MNALVVIISGILGLIIGSFLNVVSIRMNTGMGLDGRSQCFSCNKKLAWYELIPVASFIIQKGKCRNCDSRISIQYPLVELATAVAFIVPVLSFGFATTYSAIAVVISWLFACIAIVISVYDIRHMMIPVWGIIIMGIFGVGLFFIPSLYDIAYGYPATFSMLYRGIAALALPLPFFLTWVFSKGRLFGIGDVELMIPIGLSLGLLAGSYALLIAFWSATLIILCIVIVRPRLLRTGDNRIMKKAIPFGPFLLAGWYIMLVFGYQITHSVASLFL